MNKHSYLTCLLFFVCAVFSSIQAMDDSLRNDRQLRLYRLAVEQNNLDQLHQLRAYLVEHELVAQEEIDGHIIRLGGTVPEVQPAPQAEQAEAAPQQEPDNDEQVVKSAEVPGEMEGEAGESGQGENSSQAGAVGSEAAAEQQACAQQAEQRLALLQTAIDACDVNQIRQCLYVRLADMPQIFETDRFAALSDEDQAAVRAHFDAVTRNIARNLEDDARIFHNDPLGFVERLEPAAVWFGVLELGTFGRRCCACRDCMFSQENQDLKKVSTLLCDYFCHLIEQELELLQQACRLPVWQDCHRTALDHNFTALLNATLSPRRNIHRICYLWYHYFATNQEFRDRALKAIRNFADIVIENRDNHYSPEERLCVLASLRGIFEDAGNVRKERDPYFERIEEARCQAIAQVVQGAIDPSNPVDVIVRAHAHAILGTYHFICTRMMHDFNAIEEGHLNILQQLWTCLPIDQGQYRALLIQLAQSLQTEGGESAELLRNLLACLQTEITNAPGDHTPPCFLQLLHELQEAQHQGQEVPHQAQGAGAGPHLQHLPIEGVIALIGDNLFPIGVASAAILFLGMRFFRGRR